MYGCVCIVLYEAELLFWFDFEQFFVKTFIYTYI